MKRRGNEAAFTFARSHLDLGIGNVPTPRCFTLERHAPVTDRVPARST
jgi:hypothetical protein